MNAGEILRGRSAGGKGERKDNMRLNRRAIFSIVFVLLGGMLVPRTGAGDIVDRIVAVVNDDVIVLSDLNRAFQPLAGRIRALGHPMDRERRMLFKAREDLLNQMIDEKLADQEIKKYNVKVQEREIDNAIEQVKRNRMLTDEQLRQAMKLQGFTIEQYRQRIREEILRTRLVNSQVRSKIVITDAEIEKYYNENTQKYGGAVKYHLHNLVILPSVLGGTTEVEAAWQILHSARQQLLDGKPFDAVAAEIRQQPGGGKSGEIGAFPLKSMAPLIANAVKGLKAGQFTDVLDTEKGPQIFYVSEISREEGQPLEAVADEIQQLLYRQIVDQKFSAWLKELREKSYIKVIL